MEIVYFAFDYYRKTLRWSATAKWISVSSR